jgi:hypothetical protein
MTGFPDRSHRMRADGHLDVGNRVWAQGQACSVRGGAAGSTSVSQQYGVSPGPEITYPRATLRPARCSTTSRTREMWRVARSKASSLSRSWIA